MAPADLYKIAKYAIKLHDMLKTNTAEGEGWQQSKITKAADYMGSEHHAMDYDMKFAEPKIFTKNIMKRKVQVDERYLPKKVDSKLKEESKGLYYYVNKNKKSGKHPKKGEEGASTDSKIGKTRQRQQRKRIQQMHYVQIVESPSWKTLGEDYEKKKVVLGKACWKGF